MGYVNPVLQYGVENFCKACAEVGVDGAIVPDLPMYEYEAHYQSVFDTHGLSNIFLVTPQTSEERIRKIDSLSTGFRSEEHTSELQSLMRISYAVLCLKK